LRNPKFRDRDRPSTAVKQPGNGGGSVNRGRSSDKETSIVNPSHRAPQKKSQGETAFYKGGEEGLKL